jgi:uncharacterized membrane protein YdfJ with MMPL/SSD domain
MTDPRVVSAVRRYQFEVGSDQQVTRVISYVDLLDSPQSAAALEASALAGLGPSLRPVSAHTGLMVASFKDLPNSPQAAGAVQRIRSLTVPKPLAVLVGGEPAFNLDWTNGLYKSFPWIVAAVLGITYVLLMIGFHSVFLPLKAIIMNLLSIAAAYGAVTFIFQDGHLSNLLNFQAQPSIESTVPIVMFAGLFGLSMDYEVFLLSRVAEEYRRGSDNRTAVALGMERTGRIITSAALVMVIVFGFFAFSTVVITKEIGLGFAIAVLVDATIIRLLMVPAWMRVFGDLNWWFPRFRRLD